MAVLCLVRKVHHVLWLVKYIGENLGYIGGMKEPAMLDWIFGEF